MPSNRVILAAAGSRKTTTIVNMALAHPEKRTLVLTFTIENLATIRSYFIREHGMIPRYVTLQSWYSFLLQDGTRPYQSFVYSDARIDTVYFDQRPAKFPAKKNARAYYMAGGNQVCKDYLAEFVHQVNDVGRGCVIKRLEAMYDVIYIDEIQDMSGYDWELIEELMSSRIEVCCVGDPRQATYATSNSLKNSKYKGGKCEAIFKQWVNQNICKVLYMTECYRSNQAICDFADGIFPGYVRTTSRFTETSGHDGVYKIKATEALAYHTEHQPTVLRYRIDSNTFQLTAFNIGLSKGKTFDRVLIFPTEPMVQYLLDRDPMKLKDQSKSNLYVAITRARYSVIFVVTKEKIYDQIKLPPFRHQPFIAP